jgi:hypothetical protein
VKRKGTIFAKVPFKRPPVHAFTPASFLLSFRLEAARAVKASLAFSKASLTVSADRLESGILIDEEEGGERRKKVTDRRPWLRCRRGRLSRYPQHWSKRLQGMSPPKLSMDHPKNYG